MDGRLHTGKLPIGLVALTLNEKSWIHSCLSQCPMRNDGALIKFFEKLRVVGHSTTGMSKRELDWCIDINQKVDVTTWFKNVVETALG